MKRNLRKFLSLLMVFALLCGLVPAAFAAVDQSDIDWEVTVDGDNWLNVYYCQNFGHEHKFLNSYGGYDYYVCERCGAEGTIESAANTEDYYEEIVGGHTHRYTYINNLYHEVECWTDENCEYWVAKEERHTGTNCVCMGNSSTSADDLEWESNSSVCLDNNNPSRYHDPVYVRTEGDYYVYKCSYCDELAYAAKDGSSVGANGLSVEQYDDMSGLNTYTANENVTLRVYPTVTKNGINITADCTFTYEWSGDIASASAISSAKLNTTKTECSVSCKVTAKDSTGAVIDTVTVTWYATEGMPIEVEATIYNTNTGYYLSDVDDEGYTSIEEQIVAAVDALEGTYDEFHLEYVKFGDVDEIGGKLSATTSREYYYYAYSSSAYTLAEVVFTPTAKHVGKVVFPFTAYYEDDNNSNNDLAYASGTLTFDVQEGKGLGIVYTALAGEDVILDEADFVEFWEEAYPYGTLDYVKFGSVLSSKGKLYDAANKQISTTSKCYYYPERNQTALEGVTFVPKSATVTGAVEITFDAYGSTRSNGVTSTTPVSGKITILYTAKEVTPIEYLSTGTAITLKADDFLAKYKEVMGAKTATASSLNIQFLEAPAYGSLYLNYKATSFSNGTELTDKNILNYIFNGRTTATRSIEDVSYVPGAYSSVGETLRFACYYNNQLKFVGTVKFGAADPIVIEYTTSGVAPVTFSAYDFYNASLPAGYLYFGTPSYGTLYRSYVNGVGVRVNPYDTFSTSASSYGSVYSLNTLTYVPSAGYVGVVEIPVYTAATLYNTQMVGTVKVYVGRSFTDVQGTPSAWAIPYINKLSAQGIVNGTDSGMTKFSPTKTVTYGEALKLIMMAAGYPEQAKTSTHWASGYLTKAYYDGLVSSSTAIDLNAEVTRDTIASITAKALKLSYATSVNYGVVAPTDSTNGYVYALYNAGIVNGTYNAAGQNVFNGGSAITRAEISKIVCMISDYAKAN